MRDSTAASQILDYEPATSTFLADVLEGLRSKPRTLPCKYFYDEIGSALFDEICKLDEYYLTRTELSIMRQFAPEMAREMGPGCTLVEFGSGSSIKTRVLLDHLSQPAGYIPVDISREHLRKTAERLSRAYPDLEVSPVCADFTEGFELPETRIQSSHRAVYFPGSTIGNFQPDTVSEMLKRIALLCGCGGRLLIGVDLQKDVSIIEAAYNDSMGVTARFNLNLLRRINRELDGDFDLEQFEHAANYNQSHGRVEIRLRSQQSQIVTVSGESFRFGAGDEVRTEYSHKYTIGGFAALASDVGLQLRRSWTDEDQMFGVLLFEVVDNDSL